MGTEARVHLAAEIVSAYVSFNATPVSDLTSLITSVHTAIEQLFFNKAPGRLSTFRMDTPRPEPAVPIKRSVFPNHIICLEDGKKFKSMKRHLDVQFGLTPEAYRARWGLPQDYPMVAPSYSKTRSRIAKEAGLGVQANIAVPRKAERKKSS